MDKVLKVIIPIYYGNLLVMFTDDFNALNKKYKLEMVGKELNDYGAFTVGKMKNGIFSYHLLFKSNDTCHKVISHEVVHCVNWIFKDRGIELDRINDEPQAYLHAWITGQVYRAVKKFNIVVT